MESNNIKRGLIYILKKYLSNIYFLLSFIFFIWMLFFDTNSYLTHRELNKEISELKKEQEYYKVRLDSEYVQYNNLKYNKYAREKYARENYFLKKKNEDIFIIVKKNESDSLLKSKKVTK